MLRTFAIMVVLLCVASNSSGAVISGPHVNPSNGHFYTLITSNTWTASEAEAVSLGGHLATVRSESENEWLYATFSPLVSNPIADLWIGLHSPTNSTPHVSTFVWASGEPVVFTRWPAGEPNNDSFWGGEDYTVLVRSAHGSLIARDWNDQSNGGSGRVAYGIVEVIPEPATLFLLGAGSLLCIGRSRRRPA